MSKIGINTLGQLGFLDEQEEWHWLTQDRTIELFRESMKRIQAGESLADRRCNGCGGGIMEKIIQCVDAYTHKKKDMLTFKYACSCDGSETLDDTWTPVQRREPGIMIG